MSFVKINTDDLILDYHLADNDVYTLVCRADINRPDKWNMIPSTDMVRFDMCGNERHLYISAIKRTQLLQSIKYPQVNKIKEVLQSDIDKFHKTLGILYNTKTK